MPPRSLTDLRGGAPGSLRRRQALKQEGQVLLHAGRGARQIRLGVRSESPRTGRSGCGVPSRTGELRPRREGPFRVIASHSFTLTLPRRFQHPT